MGKVKHTYTHPSHIFNIPCTYVCVFVYEILDTAEEHVCVCVCVCICIYVYAYIN